MFSNSNLRSLDAKLNEPTDMTTVTMFGDERDSRINYNSVKITSSFEKGSLYP